MSKIKSIHVLNPRKHIKINEQVDDLWISNIGVIDGKLHIQTTKFWNRAFGSTDPSIWIEDKDKNREEAAFSLMFLSDEENKITKDYEKAIYKHEEFVFDVKDSTAQNVLINYHFTTMDGVEGKWNIRSSIKDAEKDMIVLTDEMQLGKKTVNRIVISPIGVDIQGSCSEKDFDAETTVELESQNGEITLLGNGGNFEKGSFQKTWISKEPINISTLKSLKIDGVSLSLNK